MESPRNLRDSASSLMLQISDLMMHIGASTRQQRTDESCEALLELLVKHSRDIFDQIVLQQHIFDAVVKVGSTSGIEKAMMAFGIVLDANIMDPNVKRIQCAGVLSRLLELCCDEDSCAAVLGGVRTLREESSFSAPDVILRLFETAMQLLRHTSHVSRATALQVITTIVMNHAPQVKSIKSMTDALRTLSPSYLVRETVNITDKWFRKWSSRLLIELVRHGVFEIKSENAEALVREVEAQLSTADGDEQLLMGVLQLVVDFSSWKPLAQAFSWNPKKWRQCLFDTEWSAMSSGAQRLAIQATLAVSNLRLSELNDEIRLGLCKHLLLEPAAAAQAIKEFLIRTHEVTPAVIEDTLNRVCDLLAQADVVKDKWMPEVNALIAFLVSLHSELCQPRVWQCIDETLQLHKYITAAVLMATCDTEALSSRREHLIEVIPWQESQTTNPEGHIRLASTLHHVAMLPNVLAALNQDNVDLRLIAVGAALKMCERMMALQALQGEEHARRLDNVVTNAVEKLLDNAVADIAHQVRIKVLSGLNTQFDAYLALPDHVEALFMCRYDVNPVIQNAALVIISRVLPSHPAFVHPPLFRFQEYSIKEFEIRDSTIAEMIASAITLRTCAENKALLLQPKQVEIIVLDRLVKTPYASRSLTIEILRLLKAIMDSCGPQNHVDAQTFVNALSPIILDGHTPWLRASAMDTLGSVMRTAGVAVDSGLFTNVYTMCGKIVLNDAKEDDDPRKSAVQVLSILGAVNPVKIRAVTRLLDIDQQESISSNATEDVSNDLLIQHKPHPRSHPHVADRYPSIVLYLLVKTMQLASDPKQQQDALRCAYDTLQASPANQKSSLMAQLVPQLRRWLAEPDKLNLYELILKILADLSALLRQFKDTLPMYLGTDILKSLQLFCQQPQASQKPLNLLVVQLLDELARSVPLQDIRDHRWAVEFIHQRLSRDKDDSPLILSVVKALEAFSTFLHEKDMRHVLPHVLECIDAPRKVATTTSSVPVSAASPIAAFPATVATDLVSARQVNTACFDFIAVIWQRHPNLVKDFCAQIVHTAMRFIDEASEEEDRMTALQCLAGLLSSVGRPAQRFMDPIQRLVNGKGISSDVFKQMLLAIANGTQKIKLPPAKQEEALNPDLPLTIISTQPQLSRQEFETEVMTALKLEEKDLEVLGVSHPGGQTVIHFRFTNPETMDHKLQQFMRKASDHQATLRRNLSILTIEQRKQLAFRVSADVLAQLSSLPETKVRRKKEFTWINWVQAVCLSMLRGSPFQSFRVLGTLTPTNMWLVKEVFPFAVGAVLSQVDAQQRSSFIQLFNQTILKAPNDIRQLLFSVAEYLESERGEKKPIVVKVTKTVNCTVERETPDQKFGINYDQDSRGIIVTKLAPDGPGFRAGVPVQGVLLSINGQKARSVNEIPAMIRGVTKIVLVFSVVEEQRQMPETKPLMDPADVARAAAEAEYHAKAIYFLEVLLDQLCRNLGEGKNRKDAEAQQILQVVESLMKCYNRLGLPMEAKGVAKTIAVKFTENIIAPEQFGFDEAGTLEQLQWWHDALRLYRSRKDGADGTLSISSFLGMLRCYEALGDFSAMLKVTEDHWASLDAEGRASVAPHRAAAALALGDWDLFDHCAAVKTEGLSTVERCVFMFRQGVAAKDSLLKFIKDERDVRFERFCETFDDSYMRCYELLVELQHLTHMEEIVQYRFSATEERRSMLRGLWRKRAMQVSRQPHVWKTMVTLNSLVLAPEDDLLNRVDCVNVCSKQGWSSYADHILEGLLGGQELTTSQLADKNPSIIHSYLKHVYFSNRRTEARNSMMEILDTVRVNPGDPHAEVWGKCWFLLGEWSIQLNPNDVSSAIDALQRATELSPKNSSAFHSLGIMHYEQSRDAASDAKHEHCVAAVNALISSVQLSSDGKNSVMQDMLRILAIWFAHGGVTLVNEAVHNGMTVIPDHVWLRVIPQLIARMGINSPKAREILSELLIRVGSRYPHAFIYPITVSEKSTEVIRRKMAEKVLGGIRQSCDQLVKEASLISNELVRMAILWGEKWFTLIQAAAQKQDDAAETLRILQPLFEELDHPSTPNERNFEKSFGQTLKRAKTALTSKVLDQAWQLLKQVYSNVGKLLAERKMMMSDVSPVLDSIHKSIVAVPGTFDPSKVLISINKFQQKVIVMPSKQKPRKFGLEGSDGRTYRFLLKGHEDLRQDERVMQFLDLINTIFAADAASTTLELFIPRFSVVPLTDNVGLIGWVENTETIYKMLETRRQEYNISVYEEVNLMVQKGGIKHIDDYHRLPKASRVELLGFAIQNTPSDELNRIMWDRNDACEQWLEYRRLYAHTLAIMSMVGYVLGLGDRHLNNLMLQQGGAVVHIDFGDCFEVAMHRPLYAEAVPFRLTRILVHALGVTGVDGVYRHTCEHVMKLLRRHKENLLSVLEAFIYDPLINWKLTAQQRDELKAATTSEDAVIDCGEPLPSALHGLNAAEALKQPALSCTVRNRQLNKSVIVDYDGEQELRNQQAHVALLRVHAKLSGQDFDRPSSEKSSLNSTAKDHTPSSLFDRGNLMEMFGESLSVAGPLLAAYVSPQPAAPGDVLDVPQQVERLIQEASSLDNLAEAYITGWAPFW